jgi:hypothetical protein
VPTDAGGVPELPGVGAHGQPRDKAARAGDAVHAGDGTHGHSPDCGGRLQRLLPVGAAAAVWRHLPEPGPAAAVGARLPPVCLHRRRFHRRPRRRGPPAPPERYIILYSLKKFHPMWLKSRCDLS